METIRLNNGVEMPLLGYGLFKVDPKESERCVKDALSSGLPMVGKRMLMPRLRRLMAESYTFLKGGRTKSKFQRTLGYYNLLHKLEYYHIGCVQAFTR